MSRAPTKLQQRALLDLWRRNPTFEQIGPAHQRPRSFLQFRRTTFWEFGGGALMVNWCGMVVGIEPDGYTHMKRSCGGCTQCCKLMGVTDLAPPKPQNVWCAHCVKGVGCRIYEKRPQSCRDFECLWLKDEQGIMGDDLRPDRIGVVVCVMINGATTVKCSPGQPTAWRHPQLLPLLQNLARAGYPVGVEAGKRYWIITGTTEWEAPEECKTLLANGAVAVNCPDDVADKIGLFIRPECKSLGPVLNPILTSKTL